MPSEFLLDTNTVIYLFRDHAGVRAREQSTPLRYLAFITATELLFGAKNSAKREGNLSNYERFISRFSILYPDRTTLNIYSDLRLVMQKLGKPIPANDFWQAALALQHNAVLVTNDSHFAAVPGLRREDWTT